MNVNHLLEGESLIELVDELRSEVAAIVEFRPDDTIVAIEIDVAALQATVRVRRPD